MWIRRILFQRTALLLLTAVSLLAPTSGADDAAPPDPVPVRPGITPGTRKVITGTLVLPGSAAPGQPGQPEGGRRTVTIFNENGVLTVRDGEGTYQRHLKIPAHLPYEVLVKRLQELQQAAGDPDAVKRITAGLLQDIQAQSPPGQPKFGLGVSLMREFPAPLRAQLKLEAEDGLLVQSVAPNGPASQAGLREYDVILEISGCRVQQHSDLVDAVQQAGEAGKPVSLLIISGGERRTVEMTPVASTQIAWSENANSPDEDRILFHTMPGAPPQFQMHYLPPGVVPGQPPMTTASGTAPVPVYIAPTPRVQVVESPAAIRKLEQRIEELEARLQRMTEQLEKLDQKR